MTINANIPIMRHLGITNYLHTWQQMQAFTKERHTDTKDEIWLTEHHSVFTLGLAGKPEHLLKPDTTIPLIKTDRGGQITYHGPGQLIIYTLLDLKRLGLSIRQLVVKLEAAIIAYLKSVGIQANSDRSAPGVYVKGSKIASLGLKVSRSCTYHGISLNVNMDLLPFSYINVCGYSHLAASQISDFLPTQSLQAVSQKAQPPCKLSQESNLLHQVPQELKEIIARYIINQIYGRCALT